MNHNKIGIHYLVSCYSFACS